MKVASNVYSEKGPDNTGSYLTTQKATGRENFKNVFLVYDLLSPGGVEKGICPY